MPVKHAEKLAILPEGFVFLGQGLDLKKTHFEERGDNLAIWLDNRWKPIDCVGSRQCYYAAKENSQAHLSNV